MASTFAVSVPAHLPLPETLTASPRHTLFLTETRIACHLQTQAAPRFQGANLTPQVTTRKPCLVKLGFRCPSPARIRRRRIMMSGKIVLVDCYLRRTDERYGC